MAPGHQRRGLDDEAFASVTAQEWWLYFEVAHPRTISHLVADAGMAPVQVTKHLERLRALGLVVEAGVDESGETLWGQGADILLTQENDARRLIEEQVTRPQQAAAARAVKKTAQKSGQDGAAGAWDSLAGADDPVAPPAFRHIVSGAHEWVGVQIEVTKTCTCGWSETFRGSSEMSTGAHADEVAQAHMRVMNPPDPTVKDDRFEHILAVSAVVTGLGVAVVVVIFLVVQVAQWFSGIGEPEESDGPSGKYDQNKCIVLRAIGLGDGPDASDALIEWEVHCI